MKDVLVPLGVLILWYWIIMDYYYFENCSYKSWHLYIINAIHHSMMQLEHTDYNATTFLCINSSYDLTIGYRLQPDK